MDQLYHGTNSLLQKIHISLSQFETSIIGSIGSDVVNLAEKEVVQLLDQASSNCDRLDVLVQKEPATRRMNSKLRADQLRYDCQHLRAALYHLQQRKHQREQEERDRADLLSRDFGPNSSNDHATTILMDRHLQHHTSLSTAHRRIDDMLTSGANVLTSLRDQRGTLKGAHRRLLDLANTLGLSNTVMRLIERRSYQDKILFWVLVAGSCAVMFFLWRYFG